MWAAIRPSPPPYGESTGLKPVSARKTEALARRPNRPTVVPALPHDERRPSVAGVCVGYGWAATSPDRVPRTPPLLALIVTTLGSIFSATAVAGHTAAVPAVVVCWADDRAGPDQGTTHHPTHARPDAVAQDDPRRRDSFSGLWPCR